jgi:NAD(P)-dependent dehydrogenase (short-subunit alcohol dehydrogenase family)
MGRASALVFAREGAKVVGCDLNVDTAEATVELVRGAGGDMISKHPCRLTDPADCQELVDLALGSFGRIDVLVNLAATAFASDESSYMTGADVLVDGGMKVW